MNTIETGPSDNARDSDVWSRSWTHFKVDRRSASVVSIASFRGRARGAGSEFVLACDLRFASRENTSRPVGSWRRRGGKAHGR
jgi:enoyl-CoA hydratase/carnithine racemase